MEQDLHSVYEMLNKSGSVLQNSLAVFNEYIIYMYL